MESEYAIECTGLEKHYPGFTLGPVDLNVERGTVVGLIGSNGAGKTTLIKLLLGLTFPSEGTIEFTFELSPSTGGLTPLSEMIVSPEGMPDYAKDKIGVVFDTCAFTQLMKVSDVGSLGRAVYGSWDAPLFDELTKSFDLDPKKQIGKLSRGMGMKLSIAFALAHHPELLILDEATAGLDPIARDEILDILRDYMMDESHTILMSSHITSDLEKLADKIVCIDRGTIVFTEQKDAITDMAGIAHLRTAELEGLLADVSAANAILRIMRREYGVDALVADRFAFADSHPGIPVDKATIDEYMNMILKGDAIC